MEKKVFIHYGHLIEKEKFVPAFDGKTKYLQKPEGGLWSSPVDSSWGWVDWCTAEEFRTGTFKVWTKFKLKPNTKILIVDSFDDLARIFSKYAIRDKTTCFEQVLAFNKIIADGYDGMYLTENGNIECHFPQIDINLYTWDCESLVLFNMDCIEIVETSK